MAKIRMFVAAVLSTAAFVVVGVQAVGAQSPADVAVLAGSCANCHGTDGRSPGAIPSIAGRPEAVLRAQLQAFKAETAPPGTTIMHRLIKGYSDQQLDALAAYFSKMDPKAEGKADAKAGAKGGKK
jgi:cytochrome c553